MFLPETYEKGDAIQVSWHIDDVKSVDDSLTDDQARTVLERLLNKHDATVGINWDVISDTITVMKEFGDL